MYRVWLKYNFYLKREENVSKMYRVRLKCIECKIIYTTNTFDTYYYDGLKTFFASFASFAFCAFPPSPLQDYITKLNNNIVIPTNKIALW